MAGPVHFFYSARSRPRDPFCAEIEQITATHPEITTRIVVTDDKPQLTAHDIATTVGDLGRGDCVPGRTTPNAEGTTPRTPRRRRPPIPSPRRTLHLALSPTHRVALSADERAELDHLAAQVVVHGDRYNPTHMGYVGR